MSLRSKSQKVNQRNRPVSINYFSSENPEGESSRNYRHLPQIRGTWWCSVFVQLQMFKMENREPCSLRSFCPLPLWHRGPSFLENRIVTGILWCPCLPVGGVSLLSLFEAFVSELTPNCEYLSVLWFFNFLEVTRDSWPRGRRWLQSTCFTCSATDGLWELE